MTTVENQTLAADAEFEAMRAVYDALKSLDQDAQNRVLDYVLKRLGLKRDVPQREEPGGSFSPRQLAEEVIQRPEVAVDSSADVDDSLAGVSTIAQKWIRRNGLSIAQLSQLFSLGLDNIDLVARSVPGQNKKDKMRSVLLLVGAATYLGTGVARINDEALREALSHYNAYDGKNFASYLKDWAPEVSGSKEAGYTLTARGLAAAAEVIKGMSPSE